MSLYLFLWLFSGLSLSATTITSGTGVVSVADREKDSALEGLEKEGPDDVDGVDKDDGPDDVDCLEKDEDNGAEGVVEVGVLATCITTGSSGLCKVIFTFLFLKVRKVASHFIQDGGTASIRINNKGVLPWWRSEF